MFFAVKNIPGDKDKAKTMNCPQEWPEPIIRVQSLSDSGLTTIPDRYVKPPEDRPCFTSNSETETQTDDDDLQKRKEEEEEDTYNNNIPLIDLQELNNGDEYNRNSVMNDIHRACSDWGFFQVVNHGISPQLMDRAREVWHKFFHQPMEVKQFYANSPKTYEGYGSRLGVQKGAILDWGDYYFLHYLPLCLRDHNKWPHLPGDLREVVEEYSSEMVRFCGFFMKILSTNLGLGEEDLQNAIGGHDIGACLRVNFYPRCPQPDLTLGLSSHSDPGVLTVLLPDQNVTGLQVRRGNRWITVKPASHAFVVNIGDQMQVLSNAIYKSVEHRVIVNSNKERMSLAFFYNPKSDLLIRPAKELVTTDRPAMYPSMTFDDYRLYIRTKGPKGKSQLGESQRPST